MPKPLSNQGVNELASGLRLPPQPWLCITIGTGSAAVAPTGWWIE